MTERAEYFVDGKATYYRSKNLITFPKKIFASNQIIRFNKKILHSEDKLLRKPIRQWIEEINTSLETIYSAKNLSGQIENIAIIYNQAAYIMAAVGDFENAYKFCKTAIALFNKLFKHLKQEEYLFYSIQPWINLIRLDRICSKENQALTKLEFLMHPHRRQTSLYEDIIAQALDLSLPKEIVEVIENAYFFEKIKIFLQQKKYQELTELKKHANIKQYHLSVMAESEIIVFNHFKEFDKSFSIATDEYNNGLPIAMPVFLYRMMELISTEQAKEYKLVDVMMKYIQRKLHTDSSLNDLFFMFEVYQFIFYRFNECRDAGVLSLFSAAFLKENDEPGRIEVLRLASLLDNKHAEELNFLIKNSNYQYLNKESTLIMKSSSCYNLMLQRLELSNLLQLSS